MLFRKGFTAVMVPVRRKKESKYTQISALRYAERINFLLICRISREHKMYRLHNYVTGGTTNGVSARGRREVSGQAR